MAARILVRALRAAVMSGALTALAAGGVMAATDLRLPAPLGAALAGAGGPADIAALAVSHPPYAATLMAEAAALGIASPAAVLAEAIVPDPACAGLRRMLAAAVEAAPAEADVSAAVAFRQVGGPLQPCALDAVTLGAIDGLTAAGLLGDAQTPELQEIAAVLIDAAPKAAPAIAAVIAAATPRPDDRATLYLAIAAEGAIVTADTPDAAEAAGAADAAAAPPPARAARALAPIPGISAADRLGGGILFTTAPVENQSNPSPN